MTEIDTPATTTLPAIGSPMAGGFFAGVIQHGAQRFGLIVGQKAQCEFEGPWLNEYQDVPEARSYFDGLQNTKAMAAAGSEIALKALELQVGDQASERLSGWYLPARDELELLYRCFKPTAEDNYTWRSGDNPSSLPAGYPYEKTEPAQTLHVNFREGGHKAFEPEWYWSSTQYSASLAWYQFFDDGGQDTYGKGFQARARAVRRFLIT
jgi:hypothetical protein